MAASKSSAEQLITANIDIWTSAIKKRSLQGRGRSKKIELYGIKKLRELVLELAIRGLLVPQNLNDEPSSVLLEKIAAEKERLIANGKFKKQKPFAKISEEEKPYELPNGWTWARVGQIAEIIRGVTYNKNDVLDEEFKDSIPLMRANNIGRNLNFDKLQHIPREIVRDDQVIIKGDLLIAMSSGSANLVGKAAQAQQDLGNTFGAFCAVIRPISLSFYSYSGFYFSTPLYRLQAQSVGKGIGIQNLNKAALDLMLIPIPPENYIYDLVAKVDELMDLCDQLEQQTETSLTAHQTLVETLLNTLLNAAQTNVVTGPASSASPQATGAKESSFDQAWNRITQHFDLLFTTEHSIDQLKQTILQLAVMGKLVPQDPNDEPASVLLEKIAAEKEQLIKDNKVKKQKPLPPITDDKKPFGLPSGWKWCRLPDIGDLARGKSKHRPRNDRSLYVDGKIPLVQTGDVSRANGVIETYTALYNETGLAQSRLWPKGTMCITIAANIADTSVLGFDACFPDSVVGYTPFDTELDVRYFEFFIRTAKSDLEKFAPSTAQKNINLEILSQVLVPLPPKNEISRIVAKIDGIMALCDTLKEHLQKSQITQLNLANTMGDSIFGRSTIIKLEEKKEKIAMKISTELSLGSVGYDKTAVLAPLIGEGGADAKDVWNKSKLKLPEFYKQLKLEIKSEFVAKPAKAEFEG